MIRAVGFDLGETLVEYDGVPLNWQQEYPAALRTVASLWADSPSVEHLARGSAALARFNTRLVPREREVSHAVVFEELLSSMGVPAARVPDLIEPAADAFFAHFQRHARPVVGAIDVVAHLVSSGVLVGVLSDVPYGMPRRLAIADLQAHGLSALVPSTLTSVDVGFRKPDPRGFAALGAHLGCDSGEMLFVGNEQKDVVGAQAAGMVAVLLWRGPGPVPPWGQDFVIAELASLLDLIDVGAV